MAQTLTVGDGKTYSTIQAAVDVIPGDLSGQGIQTVEVYAKAPSNIYVENVDATTGFTNEGVSDYIHIRAMVSHNGQSQAAGGTGICVDGSGSFFGMASHNYGHIEGFEVKDVVGGGASFAWGILGLDNSQIYNCIVHNISTTGNFYAAGIRIHDGADVYNCIVYNVDSDTGAITVTAGIWLNRAGPAAARACNCTVYDVVNAGIASRGSAYVSTRGNVYTNCYGGNSSGKDWYATIIAAWAATYCTSSDDSADDKGGDGNEIDKAALDQFVNLGAGTEDFNVKDVAADIYHTATTPLTPNDAVGNAWASPNGSRGALEFVEAVGVFGVFGPNVFDSPVFGGPL